MILHIQAQNFSGVMLPDPHRRAPGALTQTPILDWLVSIPIVPVLRNDHWYKPSSSLNTCHSYPQKFYIVKQYSENLPPCVAVMKHNAVVHETTIGIFLVKCLQHFNAGLQLLFLQLLILHQTLHKFCSILSQGYHSAGRHKFLPFSLTFLDETAIERPMWHLKKRPKYRCFRAKLLMPDANVIKSAAHTSPWTGGDTAAAAYVCPAVVVSLLINHHSLLCGAPVALCIRLAD